MSLFHTFRQEIFGIVAQIRRSATLIAANMPEGCGRGGNAEFHHFLQMAMASASKLEYHILLSRGLHFLDSKAHDALQNQIVEVKPMLAGLIRTVNTERRS